MSSGFYGKEQYFNLKPLSNTEEKLLRFIFSAITCIIFTLLMTAQGIFVNMSTKEQRRFYFMVIILYIKTEFANCVPVWGFSKSRIRHEYLLFWFPKFIILCLNS